MTDFRDGGFSPPKHRPRRLKPSTKRWRLDELIKAVREHLLSIREANDVWFTAESIALKLHAKKHQVEQAIMKLRFERLVGEEYNRALHDTSRDPICGITGWSGWGATVYRLYGYA